MDENKDLTELIEEESPESTDLLYVVVDPDTAPTPRKVTLANALAAGAGLFGSPVDKTIATGIITLEVGDHFVALTGEGLTDDELTTISKEGGGYLNLGHLVILTGVAGLDHVITLVDGGNFKLQSVFSINNEYDSIALIQRSDGVWQEICRSNVG